MVASFVDHVLYLLEENKRLNRVNENLVDGVLVALHDEYRQLLEYESEEIVQGFERAILIVLKMK